MAAVVKRSGDFCSQSVLLGTSPLLCSTSTFGLRSEEKETSARRPGVLFARAARPRCFCRCRSHPARCCAGAVRGVANLLWRTKKRWPSWGCGVAVPLTHAFPAWDQHVSTKRRGDDGTLVLWDVSTCTVPPLHMCLASVRAAWLRAAPGSPPLLLPSPLGSRGCAVLWVVVGRLCAAAPVPVVAAARCCCARQPSHLLVPSS